MLAKTTHLGFLLTIRQTRRIFTGTKEETGYRNIQRYHLIPISGHQGRFKGRPEKRLRWVIFIPVGTDLQRIRKLRSKREATKVIVDNRPLESTRPRPDIIGNINIITRLCYLFLCGATLRVHQDVNNRGNQNNKDNHTW